MESRSWFFAWLHEMGYTFQELANLTPREIQTLQLGWAVKLEQEADAERAAMQDSTNEIERSKREHKQSIRRDLINDTDR